MTRLDSFRHRVLSAVVVVLCFAGVAAPAWPQFETRAMHPLPFGAWSIAAGDFNGDGRLDIVVLDSGGFSVSLGNGDGTFQKAVFYTTQLSYSLAVGDFNNDGKLDIVVANENLNPSTVSVYLGNGDGTFQPPISSNTTNYSSFVAVGDFNGDKKLDIVVIDSPYISVLLGNGDGTFQAPSDNNSFVGPQNLTVGDFNNDHKLDVAVVGFFGGSQNIGVLLGHGDGTLLDSLTYPLTYTPGDVSATDLNHDGNVDVAIGGYLGGSLTVLLGNGDGSFQPGVTYNTTGASGGTVIASDLNMDGKVDLAVESLSGRAGGVDVFWGKGDGTFAPAQFFNTGWSGLPVVGDFNGDRLPDLVLANEFTAVTVLNTGVMSFSPAGPLVFGVWLVSTATPPETVTLANNGTMDLAIRSIKVSGPFQATNTCGSALAAGASCTISATFTPSRSGPQNGGITIVDSASSKPQFVELTGVGTVIKVSSPSLDFGSQRVGTQSTPQVLIVTNEGTTQLLCNGPTIAGKNPRDFSETDNCTGRFIPPGGACKVNVTFGPTKTGDRSAKVYLHPQSTVAPQPIGLTGTGS